MIVERPRDLLIKKWLAHGFMICFLILILFPFFMVLSISFREGNFSVGSIIPQNPTLEHWWLAFGLDYTRADGTVIEPPYPVMLWMWNSIKISLIASLGVLAIATISAYAFSRIRIKGKAAMLDGLFLIQMFPTTLALVAIYAIFDALGEVTPLLGINSHLGLVLIYMAGVTLHIWTIKGYFDSIDTSLDKAAAIDGATPWQTFRHIFLPACRPHHVRRFCVIFHRLRERLPDRIGPDPIRIADDPRGRITPLPQRIPVPLGEISPPPRSYPACRSQSSS